MVQQFCRKNRKQSEFGFSLIELSVTLSVFLILGLISVQFYENALIKTRYAKLLTQSQTLSSAYKLFYLNYGFYADGVKQTPYFGIGDGGGPIDDPICAIRVFRWLIQDGLSRTCLEDPFSPPYNPHQCLLYIQSSVFKEIFPAETQNFKERGVLISRGPDSLIERPSSILIYNELIYDASNGVRSHGDILVSFTDRKLLK